MHKNCLYFRQFLMYWPSQVGKISRDSLKAVSHHSLQALASSGALTLIVSPYSPQHFRAQAVYILYILASHSNDVSLLHFIVHNRQALPQAFRNSTLGE